MSSHLSSLPPAWRSVFSHGYTRGQFAALMAAVDEAYATSTVFPPRKDLFRALRLVRPADVKVVILGQDPYPTPGNAHGLSFSVPPGVRTPASLKNIHASLARSFPGWRAPDSGDLTPWARHGVLLLNALLTVRSGEPMSHARLCWLPFTQAVLRTAQAEAPFIVFMLWGGKAEAVARPHIDTSRHMILADQHPSPLAQNRLPPDQKFASNDCFAEANRLLASRGLSPVDWTL